MTLQLFLLIIIVVLVFLMKMTSGSRETDLPNITNENIIKTTNFLKVYETLEEKIYSHAEIQIEFEEQKKFEQNPYWLSEIAQRKGKPEVKEDMIEMQVLEISQQNTYWLNFVFGSKYLRLIIFSYLFSQDILNQEVMLNYPNFLHQYIMYNSYASTHDTTITDRFQYMISSVFPTSFEWIEIYKLDFQRLLKIAAVSFSNLTDNEMDLQSLQYLQKIKFYHFIYTNTFPLDSKYQILQEQLCSVLLTHKVGCCDKSKLKYAFYVLQENDYNIRIFMPDYGNQKCFGSDFPNNYKIQNTYLYLGSNQLCRMHKIRSMLKSCIFAPFRIIVIIGFIVGVFSVSVFYTFWLISVLFLIYGIIVISIMEVIEYLLRNVIFYILVLGILSLEWIILFFFTFLFRLSVSITGLKTSISVEWNAPYNLVHRLGGKIRDYILVPWDRLLFDILVTFMFKCLWYLTNEIN